LRVKKDEKKNSRYNCNPTGKGGFGDRPEDINYAGRPDNENSFMYWMNYFKSLTVEEFKLWEDVVPEGERTMAANLAYFRVSKAHNNLDEFREVADRTEGKAPQSLDFTSGGKPIPILDYVKTTGENDNPIKD